jgi:hypothetical protein
VWSTAEEGTIASATVAEPPDEARSGASLGVYEAELERILGAGAAKAREIAAGTLAAVREVMGVGTPG